MSSGKSWEPNIKLPLAMSYDERGASGYNSTILNGTDQRLLNCISEPVQNAITDGAKYKLVKRPGVTRTNAAGTPYVYGAGSQNARLAWLDSAGAPVVFAYTIAGAVTVNAQAAAPSFTTLIAAATSYRPRFVDTARITGSYQMVVQCTAPGGIKQRAFFGATALGAWTEIGVASAAFDALIHQGKMEYIDGYAFVLSSDRRVYNSALNTLVTWNTGTDFITKLIEQDQPVGLARYGRQLLVFGSGSFEVMYNAGNPVGSPLSTAPQLAQRVGLLYNPDSLISTHYYTQVGDVLYFMGIGGDGVGLYAYRNGAVGAVSSPAVQKLITTAVNPTGTAVVFGYVMVTQAVIAKQTFVAIVIGNDQTSYASPNGHWLLFNPRTKEWFEGASSVFTPNLLNYGVGVAGNNGDALYTFGDTTYQNGGLNYLDDRVYQDAGTNYDWLVQFKLPTANPGTRHQHKWLGVDGDTARSAQSISVDVSDDDYQTWANVGSIDMTQQMKRLTRLGGFYSRAVKLYYTGAQPVSIDMFLSRVD